LKFCLPPPKASSKAGGRELQSESVNLKKRKKGKSDTDKNAVSEDEDEEAQQAQKKKKKAEKKARCQGGDRLKIYDLGLNFFLVAPRLD
jgi:hypothetical protein